jgi:hypothetical protein
MRTKTWLFIAVAAHVDFAISNISTCSDTPTACVDHRFDPLIPSRVPKPVNGPDSRDDNDDRTTKPRDEGTRRFVFQKIGYLHIGSLRLGTSTTSGNQASDATHGSGR